MGCKGKMKKKIGVLIVLVLLILIIAAFVYEYRNKPASYYEAYADFLENSPDSVYVQDPSIEIKFCLEDIDDDTVPELIYVLGGPQGTDILTYKNNKVVQYDTHSVFGIIIYGKSNIIWGGNFIYGCGTSRYFSLPKDGGDSLVVVCADEVYEEPLDSEVIVPQDRFWIGDDEVDRETYNEYEEKISDSRERHRITFDDEDLELLNEESLERLRKGKIQ